VQLADRFELSQLAARRLLTPPGEVARAIDALPLRKLSILVHKPRR